MQDADRAHIPTNHFFDCWTKFLVRVERLTNATSSLIQWTRVSPWLDQYALDQNIGLLELHDTRYRWNTIADVLVELASVEFPWRCTPHHLWSASHDCTEDFVETRCRPPNQCTCCVRNGLSRRALEVLFPQPGEELVGWLLEKLAPTHDAKLRTHHGLKINRVDTAIHSFGE